MQHKTHFELMKRTHLLLLSLALLLASCGGKTGIVVEIPELTTGNLLIIHAEPDQIEARLCDTVANTEFDGGKFELTLDSLLCEGRYADYSLLISSKDGKFRCTLALPLEKGKTTEVKISAVNDFIKGEALLAASYSGNGYAEAFSEFYKSLSTESVTLRTNPEQADAIYKKQVEIYKKLFADYPASGSGYSYLVGQIGQFASDTSNPLTDYASELCLNLDGSNAWASFLCSAVKDRERKALSSSVLSFSAMDINEKTFTERDIKPHKYVLVCFWASWCRPCREELPLLKQIYSKYHDKGLEIVSISIDTNPAEWLEFAKENPLPWLSVIGNGRELTNRYDFEMIPFNLIADSEGKVLKRELFGSDIEKAVRELLDK